MGDYDLYRSRISAYGNTIKEGNTNATLNFINSTFGDSPSYFEVSINGSEQLLGVRITDNSTNAANKVDYIRKIIMKPSDTIAVGDIIKWDDKNWLVISAEKFSDLYWYGMIQECNNTLKFYKKQNQTSILLVYDCVINKGNISEESNRFFSLAADEYMVCTKYNPDTASINKNTRFLLSGMAYNVIGVDNISQNGLLWIRIKEGSITPDDNVAENIADYYKNQVIREVNILNGTLIKKFFGDDPFQINIECKENGVVVTNPTVTYSSGNELVCAISETGLVTLEGTGTTEITVTFGSATDSITIESNINTEDSYNVVITPSDTTLKANRSITLNAMATNNGIDDPLKEIGFEVTNEDGSNIQYITYVVDGNSITITSGATYNKFINIKAYMKAYPNVYVIRQIKIVSLI